MGDAKETRDNGVIVTIKKKIIELQDYLNSEAEETGGIHIFLLICLVTLIIFPFGIIYILLLKPSYKSIRMLLDAKELGMKASYKKYFHAEDYKKEQHNRRDKEKKEMEDKFPKNLRKKFKDNEYWPDVYSVDDIAVYCDDGRTLLCVDENVEEFNVPDGVVNIYHRCFIRCHKLKTIVLPQSLKRIGKNAFFECISLHDIVIPKSVTEIGQGVFESCSSLEYISLPDQIYELPDKVFANCRNLHDFVFPKNVITLGAEAFKRCYKIEKIIINEKLETIGEKAFEDCRLMKEFIMPESVKHINLGIFNGCHSLEHIHFSSQIRDFGGSCCRECSNIKQISMTPMNEEMKTDYKKRWEEYSNKVDITTSENPFPESKFWTMEDSLYFGVPRLTTVCLVFCFTKKTEYTIPSFVTNIKPEAFSSCKNLRTLRLSPSIKNSCDPCERNNVTYSFAYKYWPQIQNIIFDEDLKNTKYGYGLMG